MNYNSNDERKISFYRSSWVKLVIIYERKNKLLINGYLEVPKLIKKSKFKIKDIYSY